MNFTRNLVLQFKPQKLADQFVRQYHGVQPQLRSVINVQLQWNAQKITFLNKNRVINLCHCSIAKYSFDSSSMPTSSLTIKKRQQRKKRLEDDRLDGKFNVFAYATADEYDLESLHTALTKQDLYETRKFFTESDQDVLYVRAKYKIEPEPRDIFFFRQGSVVLWNCSEIETNSVIGYLRHFELNSYSPQDIENEREVMNYSYVNEDQPGALKNGDFYIQNNDMGELEKYTFSNAMTSSVKLGIWEAILDKYIDSIEFVTDDLKEGRKIRMSRSVVLRRTGELFALRHLINLSSDLLDTPDFYWDREKLERLFTTTSSYFSIQRRINVSKTCIHFHDSIFIFRFFA